MPRLVFRHARQWFNPGRVEPLSDTQPLQITFEIFANNNEHDDNNTTNTTTNTNNESIYKQTDCNNIKNTLHATKYNKNKHNTK